MDQEGYLKLFNVLKRYFNIPYNYELLSRYFTHRKINKNEFFCREDQIQKQMGFIIKGLFRYFYIDKNGNEYTKHFAYENDFAVSYSSFIYQIPSMYYIEALEDSEILAINYETYSKNIENNQSWGIIARKFTEKIYYLKEMREKSFLLNDASERYTQFLDDHPKLKNRVKQKHIASYIGISPTSLSRLKNTK